MAMTTSVEASLRCSFCSCLGVGCFLELFGRYLMISGTKRPGSSTAIFLTSQKKSCRLEWTCGSRVAHQKLRYFPHKYSAFWHSLMSSWCWLHWFPVIQDDAAVMINLLPEALICPLGHRAQLINWLQFPLTQNSHAPCKLSHLCQAPRPLISFHHNHHVTVSYVLCDFSPGQ